MGYIGNIEVNLKSNDVNIITSGTAMTFNKGADLRISLRLANDFFLSVVFQFEDNSSPVPSPIQFPPFSLAVDCNEKHQEY